MNTGLMWHLSGRDEALSPELLAQTVRSLTRQRYRQLFAVVALAALFWGLVLSTVMVFWIRLTAVPVSASAVAAAVAACSVGIGALIAWQRRPSKLAVVIEADQKLSLKQRMSTAWEFAVREPGSPVARRLATQAVRQRLPPPTERVFPLEPDVWGKLVPLAASLLVLVSLVDWEHAIRRPGPVVDVLVADEGGRLRAYAERMQVRSKRSGLQRSLSEARNIQRLASRMEGGALTRRQALSRLESLAHGLSRQRSQALSEAGALPAGLDESGSFGDPDEPGLDLSQMLNRLLSGELLPGDAQALTSESEMMAKLGISAEELRLALESYAQGEPEGLERLLESLAEAERARGDAGELARAQQEIAKARRNLGDIEFMTERMDDQAEPGPGETDKGGDPRGEGFPGDDASGGSGADGAGWSRGYAPDDVDQSGYVVERSESDSRDVVLRPRGQTEGGIVFKSQTWALPRQTDVTANIVDVDARFAPQVEEVLAKESYPLHRKELVRRYFLNLSTGVPTGTPTGAHDR